MSFSKAHSKTLLPFVPTYILGTGLTLEKVRRVKNYWMATHRGLVKDIMSYVVYHAVHDRAVHYFDSPGVPKENYDIQFNADFLEIYCEEPPRARFPNVNARI
jgi:hypothetical protein